MNARLPTLTPRLPRDGASWATWLGNAEIPVLARTAAVIEELRELEDAVDARLLAESIGSDPLMTLKVLAHVARQPWKHRTTDAETVTEALVMLGIGPFFRDFGKQSTVDGHLAAQPEALAGLRQVLRRAHRAASFALGFAVHRMDHDAPVIHQAALLHDFAEMLLWCHAPVLALEIQRRQQADPALRSAEVQRAVLGVALADLQQRLMKAWRLPELLVRISDERHADSAQVRNVLLAIRLARHSAQGWDNPAVPDDLAETAALLNLGPGPTDKLLHDLDS
jgi:HD-like signal output (HDOD) protein